MYLFDLNKPQSSYPKIKTVFIELVVALPNYYYNLSASVAN